MGKRMTPGEPFPMTRLLLDAIYCVLLFWACPYWFYKLPQARRYRAGLLQRMGFAPRLSPGQKRLWIHCASVGEASIPQELVNQLREKHDELDIVFSTFTDTGAERLRKLYPDATVFYWPLDLSCCVDEALRRISPDAVLLVEQELWPNFLLGCRRTQIPVGIINGRIRPSSTRFVRGIGRLLRGLFDPIQLCCARSDGDAQRYREAGIPESRICVTGSLKYDAMPTQVASGKVDRLSALFGIDKNAPVLVGGSTHPGEESVLCNIWDRLRKQHPALRLILVPRHIERAAELERTLEASGFEVARKTALEKGKNPEGTDTVILVDTIGDLVTCYGMATCVFVGRSLHEPGGGQNMMEPAGLGIPVVVGPHTGNFRPEMAMLRAWGGVVEVGSEIELEREVDELLSDAVRRRNVGERGQQAVRSNKGATRMTRNALERIL